MNKPSITEIIEQSPAIIEEYWFEFERYFKGKYGEDWVNSHGDVIARMCIAAAINTHTGSKNAGS